MDQLERSSYSMTDDAGVSSISQALPNCSLPALGLIRFPMDTLQLALDFLLMTYLPKQSKDFEFQSCYPALLFLEAIAANSSCRAGGETSLQHTGFPILEAGATRFHRQVLDIFTWIL